jgi:acyl-CoA synthetase (NDP forming)
MTEKSPKDRLLLNEVEAKGLFKQAGVPVVDTRLARTTKQAVALGRDIGFPVVLKIVSPDVVHKSDVGGVKVGLSNAAQVARAYAEIVSDVSTKLPGARIEGMAVQAMAPPGVEVIIGMSRDAQFGPVVMFGMGGIWVEALRDVAFRLVPVTAWDAAEMVREIKGYSVLQGYRGAEPSDIPFLEKVITRVSALIEKNPQVQELDINPLIAYRDGAVAVDARIIIEPPGTP